MRNLSFVLRIYYCDRKTLTILQVKRNRIYHCVEVCLTKKISNNWLCNLNTDYYQTFECLSMSHRDRSCVKRCVFFSTTFQIDCKSWKPFFSYIHILMFICHGWLITLFILRHLYYSLEWRNNALIIMFRLFQYEHNKIEELIPTH